MKLTYNPHLNVAYIRFQEKQTGVQAIQLSEDFIVDVAPNGTIYGIELLNANEQLAGAEAGKLLLVNEETNTEVELELATK